MKKIRSLLTNTGYFKPVPKNLDPTFYMFLDRDKEVEFKKEVVTELEKAEQIESLLLDTDGLYNILRDNIASQVGYTKVKGSGCDSGNRIYGTSNDDLIKMCVEIINEEIKKSSINN
jgi:hypothetical protein